jgi:diguanylate cyclase (GGDEF)-like protein/PAS domain S-box-containing protein
MTQKSVRALLIEDDRIEAELIAYELSRVPQDQIGIEHVRTLADGVARLTARSYDVVLLDLGLPDGSGLGNLDRIRSAAPNVAVVILTNREDDDGAVASLAQGAQDYLIKRHITSELLRRSIRYALARQEAEASLRASEERYTLAAAGARDGIWDWDLSSGRIYFSPRWFDLLQLPPDTEASPAVWFDRVAAEDRIALEEAFEAHLSGRTPHIEHEFRIRNGADQLVWVMCRGVAVRGPAGEATRVAGSLTDIGDRKLAEARLKHELLHDTLTGLPNRTLFLDRLDHTLGQQRREPGRTFAVLFLDLDGFKAVNDSLGHAAGDELLVQVGRRLRMFVRPGDSVARLGGDEFAVLAAQTADLADATRLADRIHSVLSLKFVIGQKEVYTGASIGIALSAGTYERPGDLLRDADMAMYRTKSTRTGSSTVFQRVMHDSALNRLELEIDLRSALRREELIVYYQPIVALDGMRLVGFEALLRWNHPVRGIIGPDVFIPLAEKCGLIAPVSWWVTYEACRQTAEWRRSDPRCADLSVSINVSSRLFFEPDFAARTSAILDKTGLAPGALHLEITENALLDHESSTVGELRRLRETGVKFHLDDFGTGYSSLSYLNRFEYDTIKIDRSFVATSAGARSGRIIDAIISLARTLGMDVIAEGVETSEQVRKLLDLNCNLAQGFLFSRPVPADAAAAFLDGRHTPADFARHAGAPSQPGATPARRPRRAAGPL